MFRFLFGLFLFTSLIPTIANAQLRYMQNSAKVTNSGASFNQSIPGFPTPLPDPIVTLPQPLPNPISKVMLTELNSGISVAIPTSIGSDTLNSSDTLFTIPSPGPNRSF